MVAEQSWVEGVRADALAKIFLTRRDELDVIPVSRSGQSLGYDILVRVQDEDASVVPEFAVSVKGV